MNQKKLKNYISEEVLAICSNIVGKKIYSGYIKPTADFVLFKNSIECEGVAIRLRGDDKFIVFEGDWLGDTPDQGLDCQKLDISFSSSPTFLNSKEFIRKEKTILGIQDGFKVSFFEKDQVVNQIEIYEFAENSEDESVSYDKAFVFLTQDLPIVIETESSIRGNLIISTSEVALNEIKKTCNLRICIP